MATVKPSGPVANVLNTATNSYGNGQAIYIYNPTAAGITVARYDANGALLGSVVAPSNNYIILLKNQTDVINAAANTLQGSRVGLTN